MDKDKSKFPDGLNFSRPSERAPDFIKGRVGVNPVRFIKWLQEAQQKVGGEWINLSLLQSKDGSKLYFQLDDWKPNGHKTPHNAPESTEDIPIGVDVEPPF